MSVPSFHAGVLAQPENLRDGAERAAAALADADLAPFRTGTLVLSGIGASGHALVPAARALRAAGRRAFAVPATELHAGLGDAFVLVSQSGASTETVAALERLAGAPVLAVSARGDSPLARGSGVWLPLGPRPDSRVATLSYTATVQALGMLCDALLGRAGEWAALGDHAAAVLEASAPGAAAAAEAMDGLASIDAVGGGTAFASAGETALLAREALRLPGTGFETREYLHGPLEAVEPGFACAVFGSARERRLAATLAGFGAAVVLASADGEPAPSGVHAFALPAVGELALPVLEILPAQLLVHELASRRGLPVADLRRSQDDTKLEAA
jgi:glucosamine--fructose-6-phosphate aminotransferase (isomerizing)